MLATGIAMGLILFATFAVLVEKLPSWLKQLTLGHFLVTDILFTALSFLVFPVVGAATLISTGVFCLLITLYLSIRRSTTSYTRIELGKPFLLKIVRYDP